MNATINSNDAVSELAGNSLTVEVQCVLDTEDAEQEEPPSPSLISQWAEIAYTVSLANETERDGESQQRSECIEQSENSPSQASELTVRLVSEAEMLDLNRDYRGKNKSTNVLSFAVDMDPQLIAEIGYMSLGDIVICHRVVAREAKQQQKKLFDHYAHMVTHGVLHLCGYDHQEDQQAEYMEALETRALMVSGIADPYQ